MKFADGLQRLACAHYETTALDGEGLAICLRCGAVIQAVLTLAVLQRTMDAIWKRERGT